MRTVEHNKTLVVVVVAVIGVRHAAGRLEFGRLSEGVMAITERRAESAVKRGETGRE